MRPLLKPTTTSSSTTSTGNDVPPESRLTSRRRRPWASRILDLALEQIDLGELVGDLVLVEVLLGHAAVRARRQGIEVDVHRVSFADARGVVRPGWTRCILWSVYSRNRPVVRQRAASTLPRRPGGRALHEPTRRRLSADRRRAPHRHRRRRLRGHHARRAAGARAQAAAATRTSRCCCSRRTRASRRSPSSTWSRSDPSVPSSASCGFRRCSRTCRCARASTASRRSTRERQRRDHRRRRRGRVLAPGRGTGAVPFVPPVPGLAERAITMWSVADAQKLQSRARAQAQARGRACPPPSSAERRSRSPCAAAARPASRSSGRSASCCRSAPPRSGSTPATCNIHLVEGRPRHPLRPAERRSGPRRARRLEKMGVEVVTGSMVERVERRPSLTLADGREVPAAMLVWCGGAKADPHAAVLGVRRSTTSGGSSSVPDSKAQGFDDVYVLGDVAAFRDPKDNRVLPMLAQFAITAAEHATGNILREIDGGPTTPFVPNQHGEFVSVGPSWGVGWMFGARALRGPRHLHEAAHLRPVLVAGRRSQARVEARARAARDAALAGRAAVRAAPAPRLVRACHGSGVHFPHVSSTLFARGGPRVRFRRQRRRRDRRRHDAPGRLRVLGAGDGAPHGDRRPRRRPGSARSS